MKSENILEPSASLLGVALLIVTAVHVTGRSATRASDEIAFAAALLFIGSCLFAHRAISKSDVRYDSIADRMFFTAQFVLLTAVISFWF